MKPIKINSTLSTGTLNKLRAAVLGANDGIVSTSSVVMGVAGATTSQTAIFTAGMAALVAGALSMAVGEYVSVSSQSDAEKSARKNGITKLFHGSSEIVNPFQAAVASLLSFTAGGLVPFGAIVLAPEGIQIQATVLSVLVALIITGYISAAVGRASKVRAILRVVVGGLLAMAITYAVGLAFGTHVL